MNSFSERRKSVDRISNLPNNLISHILSFLSTKDAVGTSVLSTKWIHHWTSVTRLDFEESYQRGIINSNDSQPSLLNFVYRVLLFKVTHLDLFRLKTWSACDAAHVNLWLSAALSRHVRQIDLTVGVDVDPLPPHPWPPLVPRPHGCLFSSRNLVVLKLGRGFLLIVPTIISLDSLKILHFSSIEFEDGESLSRLVSSCPVLEELKMQGKLGKTMDVFSISSLVLKRLILDGLDAYPYEVVLNTPSLEYFEHVDSGVPEAFEVEMKTLHCLDRAHLFYKYGYRLILEKSMADLAVAISNVRFLHLSQYAFEAFYQPHFVMPIELPKFPRLTDLKIDVIERDEGMSLMVAFLQASPQLASLSFGLEYIPQEDELSFEDWHPPTAVPFCMQQNLKVIEVDCFTGRSPDLSIIKYFLGKTISLEKLIILANLETMTFEKLIKILLKLPKASKSCKIEFA